MPSWLVEEMEVAEQVAQQILSDYLMGVPCLFPKKSLLASGGVRVANCQDR